MRVRLAADVFRLPGSGYLELVHTEKLPWDHATEIVERANWERTIRRELDEPSPVSRMEIALCAALLRVGLDDFKAQAAIGPFDADFLFDDLVVEVDGQAFHDSDRDAMRDSIMRKEGYRVLRFTGREVYHDPFWCTRMVRESLREALAA